MKKKRYISGIYKITCKENNRIYIGSSFNISSRWKWHINDLSNSIHVNKELQDDFNRYEITAFIFEVIKIVNTTDKLELLREEQLEINNYDFDILYNTYNSLNEYRDNITRLDEFMGYINSKWLVPIGTDNKDLDIYKIYRKEDKNNIINMAIKCKLYNLSYSKITFNRIIRTMKQSLGYEIDSIRQVINGKQHTYKIILSFDEKKVNFIPPLNYEQ